MKQPNDTKETAVEHAGLGVGHDTVRLHAETQDFIAREDIDGLATAMRSDAAGVARRLAQRLRRHQS